MFRRILTHPLARDLDLDDVDATIIHRKIIQEKSVLQEIYSGWYRQACAQIPQSKGSILEIGSGPGFFRDFQTDVICSDILSVPGMDVILDAKQLPIGSNSLRAIALFNVLHHLPDASSFIKEAARCLVERGVMIMIEPWVTPWSRFIYKYLHHEPFETDMKQWIFETTGPLSGANGAMPWIIFHRDQKRFLQEHPEFEIVSITPHTAISYLLSGGLSMRSILSGVSKTTLMKLEGKLTPWMCRVAMFATITLKKAPLKQEI